MKRPEIMGIQSGDSYLRERLNEYSVYCDYLEERIKYLEKRPELPLNALMWEDYK